MGTKRKFKIVAKVEIELEIDQSVIDHVDDEWKKTITDMEGAEDIADYIAYGLMFDGKLSSIEGFCDMADDLATITEIYYPDPYDVEEVVEAV